VGGRGRFQRRDQKKEVKGKEIKGKTKRQDKIKKRRGVGHQTVLLGEN